MPLSRTLTGFRLRDREKDYDIIIINMPAKHCPFFYQRIFVVGEIHAYRKKRYCRVDVQKPLITYDGPRGCAPQDFKLLTLTLWKKLIDLIV